ncbi:MAG: hypothetical protein ACXWLC_02255 [Rhizomicrobium sp.]
MTRRILRSFSDNSDGNTAVHEGWPANVSSFNVAPEARPSRRDTEDMLAHVTRSENESGEVFRRIEEQLRGVARRLEATERSQSENNRAMTKAASEINVAAREQAQAFDQLGTSVIGLADRIDRVERMSANEGLKDAVKGLHQGLSRLADQISATANQSASQISALADNLESVAGRLGQVRSEAEATNQIFEKRIAQIDELTRAVEHQAQANLEAIERQISERIRGVEQQAQASQEAVAHAMANLEARKEEDVAAMKRDAEAASAISRLEDNLSRLEARGADPVIDQRLSGIERTLGEIANRFDQPDKTAAAVEDGLKRLAQRIEAAEAQQRDSVSELRAALNSTSGRIAAIETVPHPVTGGGQTMPFPPAAAPVAFDAPPFADMPAPESTSPFAATADPFAASEYPFAAAEPVSAPPLFEAAAAPFAAEAAAFGATEAAPFGAEAAFGHFALGADPFAAEETASAAPAASDSYLSAARRSARAAAAQVESERTPRTAGFSWGGVSADEAADVRPTANKTYIVVGVIALVLILALAAGVILSQRLSSTSTHTAGPLFDKAKPAVAQRPVVKPLPSKDTTTAAAPSPVMSTVVVAPTQSAPATTAPTVSTPPVAADVKPLGTHTVAPSMTHSVPAANSATSPPTTVPVAPTRMATIAPLDKLTALANSGNAKAELVVGLKYLDGDGVAVSETDAAKWLERAANAGLPVAQYRLGTMYERGRGVAADPAKSVHWYTLAAQAGNRKAMHNLAVAYASGTGVAKNLAEAARWFSKAASLGLSDSQFNLAVLYERGLGVPQSLLDAYKWYAIAAAAGDTESKTRIDALATQLSADDRAAAQHSADAFRPQPLNPKANVAPLLTEIAN